MAFHAQLFPGPAEGKVLDTHAVHLRKEKERAVSGAAPLAANGACAPWRCSSSSANTGVEDVES